MRNRIADTLETIGDGIYRLAERIRPQEDIGEGWWSLSTTPPLEEFEGKLTFMDVIEQLPPNDRLYYSA